MGELNLSFKRERREGLVGGNLRIRHEFAMTTRAGNLKFVASETMVS